MVGHIPGRRFLFRISYRANGTEGEEYYLDYAAAAVDEQVSGTV